MTFGCAILNIVNCFFALAFVPDFYSLPLFLDGIVSSRDYNGIVYHRASVMLERDRHRKIAIAFTVHVRAYADSMNSAVCKGGRIDPYTGDTLDWSLVRQWNDSIEKNLGADFMKKFSLMPTFSHLDLYHSVGFEVCSWRITTCKSSLTGPQFVDLCKKVVSFRDSHAAAAAAAAENRFIAGGAPGIYFPPGWMSGIVDTVKYRAWLLKRAKEIRKSDLERGRVFAKSHEASDYRRLINDAVYANGRYDPFTGDTLDWTLIKEWDTSKSIDSTGAYIKKFALLPVVDHIDPEAADLRFEICANQVNLCKSHLTPDEFVALCRRIVAYRDAGNNKR
jgi:hypothetical protein